MQFPEKDMTIRAKLVNKDTSRICLHSYGPLVLGCKRHAMNLYQQQRIGVQVLQRVKKLTYNPTITSTHEVINTTHTKKS